MRRRGQGRSNVYTLYSENPVRNSETTLPEAQILRIEEDEKEKDEGENLDTSMTKNPDILSLDTNPVITEEPRISSPPSSPVSAPQLDSTRAAIFPYVKDLARELNDESSLTATTTRAVRIFHRSGLSLEAFQDHLLLCRQRTQERSASVKRRRADGIALKVPYFFAVLENSLFGDSQSSPSSTLPYPQSPPLTRYFPANHTNPSVQGKRDFWNDRE
jgi:hypothetical protein